MPRPRNPIQLLLTLIVFAACIYAVVHVATDWSDWVVLGVLIVTTFGFFAAVNYRRYPTRKRAYTRESDSRFRAP